MGSSSSSENHSNRERRASRASRNAPPPGASTANRTATQPSALRSSGGAPPQQQRPHGPSVVHQQQHAAPPPSHQPPRQLPPPAGHQPPPMPQHLMQHQHPSYQQRAPAPAAPSNFAAASVSADAVKEAKNVTGLCTIHSKKVQIIEDCISFVVTTTVPVCDYEIHTAIRETIRKGEVIFTPNKAKQPPQRITIEGEHDDLELVVPLELDEVSDQEKQYIKEYPKQIPLAIVLRYVVPETGVSMCEFTYVQISPKPQVFRQMVQTPEGVFKVESIFGADDGSAATAVVADSGNDGGDKKDGESGGGGSTNAPIIDDDDEDDLCVICLTEPKDTIVLPCRHLCVCKGCAERLRKENVKQQCPVCRGPIDQLLHVNK